MEGTHHAQEAGSRLAARPVLCKSAVPWAWHITLGVHSLGTRLLGSPPLHRVDPRPGEVEQVPGDGSAGGAAHLCSGPPGPAKWGRSGRSRHVEGPFQGGYPGEAEGLEEGRVAGSEASGTRTNTSNKT